MALDSMIDLLWTDPPGGARRQVQALLRSDLADAVVVTDDRARLDRSLSTDEDAFRKMTHSEAEIDQLEQARDLWRGPRPFQEIADHPDALAAVHDLETRRLSVLARIHRHELLHGDTALATSEIAAAVALSPDALPLRRLHSLGLALSGRRIEALRELQSARSSVVARVDPWATGVDQAIQADDRDALRRFVVSLDLV